MSHLVPFKENASNTIGVELELQLINLKDFNLATEASDFLRRLSEQDHPGIFKPEITQAMIEFNSSIHSDYASLLSELITLRKVVSQEAAKTHLGVCGGGTHPFQKWKKQRIYPTERFSRISEQYGYLAKQFTIFGQHIHLGCSSGNDALYLCHAFARYIPHFIALSACSPFQQGVDTGFDCSRLGVISTFPLSGTPPWILNWQEFEDYFDKLYNLGIVKTMKDFYWDIRPKPEFGTIELRICDTPLTVEIAAELAAYAQLIMTYLLDKKPEIHREMYYTYLINRFRAMRYGLDAGIIDINHNKQNLLSDEILQTCRELEIYAIKHNSLEALQRIRKMVTHNANGAKWLRSQYAQWSTLEDVVRSQTQLWMG